MPLQQRGPAPLLGTLFHEGDEVTEVSDPTAIILAQAGCLLLAKAKPDTATTLVSGLGTGYGC